LEIGAANPEQVEAHRRIFGIIVGLDLGFERLPKQSGMQMVNADAQCLPFKNNIFDGIISHHVIEHVEKDRLFIGEVKRTLKNGGFAILGTPNRERLISFLAEVFFGKKKFPWREHKREYTRQELYALVNNLGFREVFVYSKFLGLHPYSIALGFSRYPRVLDRWSSFLFLVVVK
jgi:ubiquinone/menaquinone biosynthesis C-methylase UbiE